MATNVYNRRTIYTPVLGTGVVAPTFSFISGVTTAIAGPSPATATGAIDTTNAGLLIAAASYYFPATGMTPTDSKGNESTSGWNTLTTVLNAGACGVTVYWCKPTSVGAGHTFSLGGLNTYYTLSFAAFTLGAVAPFDQESGNTGSSSSASGSSITPGVANELVIAALCTDTATVTSGDFNGGFTKIDNHIASVSGQYMGGGMDYLIQTSAAAAAPTSTLSGSSGWAVKMASFKVS